MKSKSAAYVLWLLGLMGVLGFHRMYLGKWGTGLLWMFTGGLFGVGAFIDLFSIGSKVDQYNTDYELKTLRKTTTEMARASAHKAVAEIKQS